MVGGDVDVDVDPSWQPFPQKICQEMPNQTCVGLVRLPSLADLCK
jgi:hypothetical protein